MVVRKRQKYEFWIDKTAREVVEREKKLNRGIEIIRTEMGIGASGIPHVGSVSDGTRAYGVKVGIEDLGKESELIAFSDTRDGLRKVPTGLPNWLEEHIGKPVTDIQDPFEDGHKSYGDHMSSLLIDAFQKLGMGFKFISGAEAYKSGLLNEQIDKILLNADKVGKIVKRIVGQEKFTDALPYFPVCEKCGRIYTTRAYKLIHVDKKVLYKCDQEFAGKNNNTGKEIVVKGCGHEGSANYLNGAGKLSWKVEFAARWAALKISFEAYGKDIADSVKVNDAICREILGFEPPLHIMYELFLQKGGKKISKSAGNVFTPQVWLKYGSPQSLILLMFKRFSGTRELDVTDIPKYMDELKRLERIYFKLEKIKDKKDDANLKRLFEYVNFLKPMKASGFYVPYDIMLEVAKVLPENEQAEFAIEKLKEFKRIKKSDSKIKNEIVRHLEFAKSWVQDFVEEEIEITKLLPQEKLAIKNLVEAINEIKGGEILQTKIFEIAKANNIRPVEFFRLIYRIILKSERGPRLGPYIIQVGKEEIIAKLQSVL